jgi:hypothetical protein
MAGRRPNEPLQATAKTGPRLSARRLDSSHQESNDARRIREVRYGRLSRPICWRDARCCGRR